MKKIIIALLMFCGTTLNMNSQKIALIDMEYILSNIPQYERASEQLNQISKKWQNDVEALNNKSQTLIKNYQNERAFLSAEQQKSHELAIVNMEKKVGELKMKYFGPEGELYKKRKSLLNPIHEEIYNAVKTLSESKHYTLILDRSSQTAGIIFASPSIDISNEVLQALGYSK